MNNQALEVTNIQSDTYTFYGQHMTSIQEQIEKNTANIQAEEEKIEALKKETEDSEIYLRQLKVQKEAFAQKLLELKDLIINLEKHQANFKQIIMPK